MFYRQRQHYHTHGFLFILSLIAAFWLGRKSEQCGYTIISRGCGCSSSDNEMNMMDDPKANDIYPQ
jgi:hypothetical protein